jgi:hypothetical protein
MLTFDNFNGELADLCQIKGWRILDSSASRALYEQFPDNIDLALFFESVSAIIASEERGSPSTLLHTYRALERAKVDAARSTERLEQERHLTDGIDLDERTTAIAQFCRQQRAIREGTKPKFKAQCPHLQDDGLPLCEDRGLRPLGVLPRLCLCWHEWYIRPLTEEDKKKATSPVVAARQIGLLP